MEYFSLINLLLFRGFNKKWFLVKSLGFFFIIATYCVFILPRRFNVTVSISQTTNQSDVVGDFNGSIVAGSDNLAQRKGGYTAYTIRRLGLKPLDIHPISLEQNIQDPVVNDVLSFRYPINIDPKENFKCRYWANQSSDYMLNVNRPLLIVVISAAEHSARRDMIRQTWGGQSMLEADWIQLIFMIGSTHENNVTKDRLEKEKDQYNDLVQTNVFDSYANLTLKSLAMLHWTETHCPDAQLVVKCDDDIYLNLSGLVEVLGEKKFKHTNFLYGLAIVKDRPQRDPSNKYYISWEVWPWPKYPTFLSGGGYLLGRETIRPLLAAAQTTPLFPLEDVYLTGLCARKARIASVSSLRIYEPFIPKKLDACFVRSTAMWQTQSKDQFLQSHDIVSRIYNRHLPCRTSCIYLGMC